MTLKNEGETPSQDEREEAETTEFQGWERSDYFLGDEGDDAKQFPLPPAEETFPEEDK